MDKQNLLSKLTIEDIQSPLNKWAKAIGINNVYKICQISSGKRLTLPKPDLLLDGLIKRKIIEEYETGQYTMEELADKYELGLTTVSKYISVKRHENDNL